MHFIEKPLNSARELSVSGFKIVEMYISLVGSYSSFSVDDFANPTLNWDCVFFLEVTRFLETKLKHN